MVNRLLVSSLLVACTVTLLSLDHAPPVQGFIVFLGNRTTCDFCDEYQTYSGR